MHTYKRNCSRYSVTTTTLSRMTGTAKTMKTMTRSRKRRARLTTAIAAQAMEVKLVPHIVVHNRSEEHTSELQSLMRNSYAVFCLKNKKIAKHTQHDKEL